MKKASKAFACLMIGATAVFSAAAFAACGDEGAGHTHSWGAWSVIKPTEEQTGAAEKKCTDESCGEKVEIVLPVLSDEAYTEQETAATCIAEGSVTYTYAKDGETVSFSVSVPIVDHEYADDWLVTKPTDTETGKAVKLCKTSGCTAKKEVSLPVLTDDGYRQTEESATCIREGKITYTYEKDGETVTFFKTTAMTDHVYAKDWSVEDANRPTATVEGLAVKKCTTEDCTAKLTLLLPSYTHENAYEIVTDDPVCNHSHMPLACTHTYTTHYTYRKDDETVTFSDLQEETVKGHLAKASDVVLTENGGAVTAVCSDCNEPFSYEYDNGVTLDSSTTNTLESKRYLVKSTSTANKYTYTVTKAGVHEISFACLRGDATRFYTIYFKVGSVSLTNGRGATVAGLDQDKYLVRYAGPAGDNSTSPSESDTMYIRMNLTQEDIGSVISFQTSVQRATTNVDTPTYYYMNVNFPANKMLTTGDNILNVTQEGVEYAFIPDETKKYSVTVPVGHGLNVSLVKNELETLTLIDTFGSENDTESANFECTAGVAVTLLFVAQEPCTVTAVIGNEIEEDLILSVGVALPIKLAHERRDTITLDSSVAEGDYQLTLQQFPGITRMSFQLTVVSSMGEEQNYQLTAVTQYKIDSFHLKPDDTLIFYCSDVLTDASTAITITPVTSA